MHETIFSRDTPFLAVGRRFSVPWLHRTVLEEITAGRGLAFFGDARALLPYIPPHRVKDTILIELNPDYPTAYNVFAQVPQDEHSDVAEYVLDAFSTVWPSAVPTTLLDNYLLLSSMAMMGVSDGTLFKLFYLLRSGKYRGSVIGRLKDSVLKGEIETFGQLEGREQRGEWQSLRNRLLPLVTDTLYRNVIGQSGSFTVKDTDVLLVDLPKGKRAELLAALLMSRLKGQVFIEHPQIFVGSGNPVIAVEYLGQLPDRLKTKLIGTADLLAFRLGTEDADELSSAFDVKPQALQLTELPPNEAWLSQAGTSYVSFPRKEFKVYEHSERKIRERCQRAYSQAREKVERDISKFIEDET